MAALTNARVTRRDIWSHPLDYGDVEAFSPAVVSAGLVVFSSSRAMCAFSAIDGRTRWCAGPGATPVYTLGAIAYTTSAGGINAVDASTGAHRFRITSSALSGRSDAPLAAGLSVAEHTFLLSTRYATGENGIIAISPRGTKLWSARTEGQLTLPLDRRPYVFVQEHEGGATIFGKLYVFRPSGPGASVKTIRNSWNLLGVVGRLAIVQDDRMNEVGELAQVTFRIRTVDIINGKTVADCIYAPDFANALARARDGRFRQYIGERQIVVDGGQLYLFGDDVVYRYRLAPAGGQTPLSIRGRYAAGPFRDALYVARADGIWAIRTGDGAMRATRVSTSTAGVVASAEQGGVVYLAFADGRIQGVRIDGGATVLEVNGCTATRILTSPTRMYALCRSPNRLRAFVTGFG